MKTTIHANGVIETSFDPDESAPMTDDEITDVLRGIGVKCAFAYQGHDERYEAFHNRLMELAVELGVTVVIPRYLLNQPGAADA